MEAHDRRPDDLIATVRHVDLRREYQSAREPKQRHDAVSYYNRFALFDLKINRKRLAPISLPRKASRCRRQIATPTTEVPNLISAYVYSPPVGHAEFLTLPLYDLFLLLINR